MNSVQERLIDTKATEIVCKYCGATLPSLRVFTPAPVTGVAGLNATVWDVDTNSPLQLVPLQLGEKSVTSGQF